VLYARLGTAERDVTALGINTMHTALCKFEKLFANALREFAIFQCKKLSF
jgi:hypothetical protein